MYVTEIPRAARLCLSICSVKGRKGAKEVSRETHRNVDPGDFLVMNDLIEELLLTIVLEYGSEYVRVCLSRMWSK